MADSPVVLGLDFGGTKIAMAVCEPDGELRASTRSPVAASLARAPASSAASRQPATCSPPPPPTVKWRRSACPPSGSPSTTASSWPPTSTAGGPAARPRAAGRLPRRGGPHGHRRQGRGPGRGRAGVRWSAVTRPSTSTSAPAWRQHRGRRPGAARPYTARPARSATTCAPSSDVGAPGRGPVPLEDMVSGQGLARRAATLAAGRPAWPSPWTAAGVFAASEQ